MVINTEKKIVEKTVSSTDSKTSLFWQLCITAHGQNNGNLRLKILQKVSCEKFEL